MIKNYLQIAIRNLLKSKGYVIINTVGLGIALACCITAYLQIAFNHEFDDFHKDEKVSNVFKIHVHLQDRNGNISQRVTAPMMMGPVATDEIAGIEMYTRYISGGGALRYGTTAFGENLRFVDSTFFDMFDFPLVAGNHKNFKNKYSIFLSRGAATKYFGKEDPIGKTMMVNWQNSSEVPVIVGGVLDKIPSNTSFTFDVILRIEHYISFYGLKPDQWDGWQQPSTFLKLTSPEAAPTISKQFDKYVRIVNDVKKDVLVAGYKLEPFKAPGYSNDNINYSYVRTKMGSISQIVFTSMAALILLIACFNLTNTSMAMTTRRLKEVGIRKTIGASRKQIIAQFLLETVLTILLALAAGFMMSEIIVPVFSEMWGLEYTMDDLNGLNLVVALLTLVLIASLLAGIYPALLNSRFKPVALLKGNASVRGTNALTRTLVSIQFALSVIMLIAGVIFVQNAVYQESLNYGYDKDMVISVDVQNEGEFTNMRDRIVSNPKIQNVAVCDHQINWSTYDFPVKIDTAAYEAQHIGVGKNYFETMGFSFVEGRPFDAENASDVAESLIVNQAFIDKTGIKDPIDKIVEVHGVKRHIVGVLKNHIDMLYNSSRTESFVFYPTVPIAYKLLLVRVKPSDRKEVQHYLEKTWKELFPTKPFESRFQEDLIMGDAQRTNENLKTIFLFLTFLGGVLSASGIFSLASLNVAKRTKEIGIRKTLGATAGNIVALINKEFVIILTFAMLVGSVGGFYLTDLLLSKVYAYHTTIGIIPVILCAALIFCIGVSTTSATIIRAAAANPVDTLKSE